MIPKNIEKRLSPSYRVCYRHEHVEDADLTDAEFRLLEVYKDLAIWDKKKEKFGTLDFADKDIAQLIASKGQKWSYSKVRRVRMNLESKERIRRREDKIIVIPNFERYLPKHAPWVISSLKDRQSLEGSNLPKLKPSFSNLESRFSNLKKPVIDSTAPKYLESAARKAKSDISKIRDLAPIDLGSFKDNYNRESSNREYGYLDDWCFCGSGKRYADCCWLHLERSLLSSPEYSVENLEKLEGCLATPPFEKGGGLLADVRTEIRRRKRVFVKDSNFP